LASCWQVELRHARGGRPWSSQLSWDALCQQPVRNPARTWDRGRAGASAIRTARLGPWIASLAQGSPFIERACFGTAGRL